MSALTSISSDIICHSLSFLHPKDLAHAVSTCKDLRKRADASFRLSLLKLVAADDTIKPYFDFAHTTLKKPNSLTWVINQMSKLDTVVAGFRSNCNGKAMLNAALDSTRTSQLAVLRTTFNPDFPVTNGIARRIAALCHNLTELSLCWGNRLTDEGTADFSNLRDLQKISFRWSTHVSTGTAKALAQLPSLTDVCLEGCHAMKHEAIRALLDAPKLTRLDVSDTCGDVEVDFQGRTAIPNVLREKGGRLTELRIARGFYPSHMLILIAHACQNLVCIDLRNYNPDIVSTMDRIFLAAALRTQNPRLKVILDDEPKPESKGPERKSS